MSAVEYREETKRLVGRWMDCSDDDVAGDLLAGDVAFVHAMRGGVFYPHDPWIGGLGGLGEERRCWVVSDVIGKGVL